MPRQRASVVAELDFKMDKERAGGGEEQRASSGVLDGAAAQGQYQRVIGGAQTGYCGVLAIAELCFAVAGEELGDGRAGFRLDHIVHIDEAPAQAASKERADGGFARAHEAG